MTPLEIYIALERAYLGDEYSDADRKLSAFLEKQTRFVSYLAVCALTHAGHEIVPLPRIAGLGGFLKHLDMVAEGLEATNSYLSLAATARGVARSVRSTGIDGSLGPKQYRDYLAHGGLEPADPSSSENLIRAIRSSSELITACVSKNLEIREISMAPLVVDIGNGYALFHDIVDGKAVYHTLDSDNPIVAFDRDYREIFQSLTRLLAKSSEADSDSMQVAIFRQGVRRDLEGFLEAGTSVNVDGRYSPFFVGWIRKLSSGQEERVDQFRLTRSGNRQWWDGDQWVDYASFLRSIANWQVVLSRSLDRLQDLEAVASKEENDRFDFATQFVIPEAVATRFQIKDLIGTSFKENSQGSYVDLECEIDSSAETAIGVPQVFFVTGEAGIGKTYNLFQAALRRARSLVSQSHQAPLYLYISCSGVGLKRIDELIDAAVVGTRNLDYKSVLALCRAGLIILIIDGFDELLGGAGYRDAFKLLSPTLKELGSRGTLLLSARSSYFTHQYQASLESARMGDPLPVHHMVLELCRWHRTDVDQLFTSNPAWKPYEERLGDADRALLGVPFFATAFNDYVLEGAPAEGFRGLRSVLIDAYLRREVRKLETGGISADIGMEHLRSIYIELAGMLHESAASQLDLEDFRLACSSALNIEDFAGRYKALGDRLTVLCGMSATSDEGGSPLFAFQHELFFEVLLADYISINYLPTDAGRSSLAGVLDRSVLGNATVDTLVHQHGGDVAGFVRDAIVQVRNYESTLATNLAALVTGLISSRKMVPCNWFGQLVFSELNLADIVVRDVRFANCRFGRLVVSANMTEDVVLENCHVDRFEVVGDASTELSIEFVGSVRVVEMMASTELGQPTKFVDGAVKVLQELSGRGARGLNEKLSQALDSQPSELESFAEDVLTKFSSRRENSYVIEARTRIPGNGASAWMRQPHNALWAELSNCLEASKLASVRPITASGPAKLVVSFLAPTWEVATRDSEIPEVRDFWQLVHAHR
ncbi:NACHT domain-containing protein [Nocardia testacea]|uniref:NACHT domain-containing protein n=1 Tax=Nocardia testacea TaxID=248551 RepID=A0ABW7WAT4_9NOCA